MAIEILMPALSPTMTEGNLAKWLKKEGDKVQPGEVIAEIETDKATMEVEATDEGVLAKIIIPEASEGVKVNQLIAVLLEEGEDSANIEVLIANQNNSGTAIAQNEEKIAPKLAEKLDVDVLERPNERVFATPLARRLAAAQQVNLSNIVGSGPHGRIIKNDIVNAAKQPASSSVQMQTIKAENTLIPLTSMRKVIAKRLQESKQTIPHFYLDMECNVDKLLQMRADINNAAPQDSDGKSAYRISVNDIIIKACAAALRQVPEANVVWSEQGIIQYASVDIAVAVAVDDGLITPIVHNADAKPLTQISLNMQQLVAKAKQNQLKPQEFQGGSFSISNLGMYGIKNFKAIINPPQACILAVGATVQMPIAHEGEVKIASIMNLSLSCDHRALDGAVAAKFLSKLKYLLENPVNILI